MDIRQFGHIPILENHSLLFQKYLSFQIHGGCWAFLDLECAGCPKVGEEFITEADDEEPDVPCYLRSCDEEAPGDKEEDSVKEVVDISEPF